MPIGEKEYINLPYQGKFKDDMYVDKQTTFDELHFDLLWYIMTTLKINRFTTRDSFREFLIRLFLIRDKDFNDYAIDIINDELVIDGFLNDQYVAIHIQDLVTLIGFSTSSANYHIKDSLTDFIRTYSYRPPNIKFSKAEGKEKAYEISSDTLALALMGLGNLLYREGCTLGFRENLIQITEEHQAGAIRLADFIIERLPKGVFEKHVADFPSAHKASFERLSDQDKISFNLFADMDQENLALIYEKITDKDAADRFGKEGPTEDMLDELHWQNEHIIFAYGVKHGYIKLSEVFNSLITMVDPRFQFDYDMLLGPDCELYSTQQILNNWDMDDWMNLLP